MPLTETLVVRWLALITDPWWWYNRVVDRYAQVYWCAGNSDGFLVLIKTVCIDCDVTLLHDGLAHRLAATYSNPHDQYRLTVSLGTSALWCRGDGRRLLQVLYAAADKTSPTQGEPLWSPAGGRCTDVL